MDIKLNNLKIENFKGIKAFEMELDGENAVIKAENGVGKTTVYDAFLWLLFGKNSEGKKDFEVRPLDSSNQPIRGLVLAVEAEIEYDCLDRPGYAAVHTFRKEHHEKVVKKQLRGYETLCTIDEVPKKIGEYNDYITELIPENTFKLLTDLNHFNSKLHWTDRRKVLLDIAGEIGTLEGFDELIAALNGRSIEEYKKVLAEQKKRYEKERDEINPRIDELQKGLIQYATDVDNAGINEHREAIKTEITELDAQRQKLFETEKERQEKLDLINELEKKKLQREGELQNDTTGIKSLLDEKAKIEADVAEKHQAVIQIRTNWTTQQISLSATKTNLSVRMASLVAIRDEYEKAAEAPTDDTCYACGQKLPADKLAEADENRKNRLAEITKRGNEIKNIVDSCKKSITKQEEETKELNKSLEKAKAELQKARDKGEKRFVEIDKQIESNETIPPESDKAWQTFDKHIKKTQAEIGEPVSEQLQTIDNQRMEKVNAMAQLDKALAHADRMKQDKTRIDDLEEREKELAQAIAEIEKQLSDIDEYKATESRMIEEAVNGKFKHVEFKLFNQLLNGGLDECCEATFNGVPYTDMSTGQQIFVGVDIINVLSAHYGISVPLFIDHSESLTLPIEANSQTIKLFAQAKTKKLIVEKKGVLAHV